MTTTETAYYTDQAGQQVEIPIDLIDLRRQWVAADRRHTELCQGQPLNRQVRAGEAGPASDDVIDQISKLRGRLQTLTLQIRAHLWWNAVDNKFKAERAMWAAAEQAG